MAEQWEAGLKGGAGVWMTIGVRRKDGPKGFKKIRTRSGGYAMVRRNRTYSLSYNYAEERWESSKEYDAAPANAKRAATRFAKGLLRKYRTHDGSFILRSAV